MRLIITVSENRRNQSVRFDLYLYSNIFVSAQTQTKMVFSPTSHYKGCAQSHMLGAPRCIPL